MAKTESTMLPLGTKAPLFSLPNVMDNQTITLTEDPAVVGTIIAFICNHCPYVRHINSGFTQLANDYIQKGFRFIAINSNDISQFPEDSPEKMKIVAQEQAYPFPYLFDETQAVAKAYHAACTPDFFVFDKALKLVYRGQMDDSRLGNNRPVTGQCLRDALNALTHDRPVPPVQKPSIGCNIKWKQVD